MTYFPLFNHYSLSNQTQTTLKSPIQFSPIFYFSNQYNDICKLIFLVHLLSKTIVKLLQPQSIPMKMDIIFFYLHILFASIWYKLCWTMFILMFTFKLAVDLRLKMMTVRMTSFAFSNFVSTLFLTFPFKSDPLHTIKFVL